MLTKSKAAFLLSVESLFALKRRVYLWTFTFRNVVDDEIAFKSWHHLALLLSREFKNTGGVPGIRVVEAHPGDEFKPSHGLHFHVLIARRLPIEVVRQLAIRAGMGRIHVRKANFGAAKYLGKYLGKKDDGLKRGCRRWGMFGSFKGTRVKDIVIESTLAENCRRVRSVIKTWGRGIFIAVNQMTARYGHCLDWPVFPELAARIKNRTSSDNDFDRQDGCDKNGNKARFTTVRIFCEEMGEYFRVLIPDFRKSEIPF